MTEFPISNNGYDTVLVIVKKLSKRAILIPVNKTIKASEVANIFQERLFSKHGVPITIVSHRDPKFISNYWSCLAELTNIRLNLSTTDHPQTYGQSKNLIRTLSNMKPSIIQRAPKDWDIALPELEFVYNSAKHKSTELSPFEVDIWRIPMNPMTRSLTNCKVKCHSAADLVERREVFHKIARDNLAADRAQQKYYADKNSRHVSCNKGGLVLLSKNHWTVLIGQVYLRNGVKIFGALISTRGNGASSI